MKIKNSEDMDELNALLSSSLPSEYANTVFWDILERFGGTQLYFPKEPIDNLRREKIFTDYKNGISVAKIARKYHLSEQGIYKIINKLKKDQQPTKSAKIL